MDNPFLQVMEILTSEDCSLRNLAELTKFEVVYFYKGADLRDINLTGQDLRGLNFEKADLRGAILRDVEFDDGAFNGALLDEKCLDLIDEYDVFLDDIRPNYLSYISVFYKFRPRFVEKFLRSLGIFYKQFAEGANISGGTLRRIRDGDPVSNETIFRVVQEMQSLLSNAENDRKINRMVEISKQPLIQIGFYDTKGTWIPVKRSQFEGLFSKLEYVNFRRYGADWRRDQPHYIWNSRPVTIEWAYNFYMRNSHVGKQLSDDVISHYDRFGVIHPDDQIDGQLSFFSE